MRRDMPALVASGECFFFKRSGGFHPENTQAAGQETRGLSPLPKNTQTAEQKGGLTQAKRRRMPLADSGILAAIGEDVSAPFFASSRPRTSPSPTSWSLDTLAGRFIEVTGAMQTAALSVAAALVLEAQQRGEWAAWISGARSTFYPPDFEASGIDLAGLPVIRVTEAKQAWRAADTLLRSGGFALVLLDTGRCSNVPLALQTRLGGLAKKHHTALVCITRQGLGEPSANSLVSLRAETEKEPQREGPFQCTVRVVKDKGGIPGWGHAERRHGPAGLC